MDYQNGRIYKIVSNQTDKVYIGSTCSPLYKRLYAHRKHYKVYLSGKTNYITSFDIIKFEDNDIQLIENYPCKSKEELHAREGFHIRQSNCVNKCIAGRSVHTYYFDNIDKIKQNRNMKNICECGGAFTKRNISTHIKSKKHKKYVNLNTD
jgi:hypothetical protein